MWARLAAFLGAVWWSGAGSVVLQGCEDDRDCQYADCVNYVGYVDSRPSWQRPSGGATGVCALNVSAAYDGYHCQFRKSYIVWGEFSGREESIFGPCVPGPCVTGKFKVSGAVADQCVRERDGVLQGCLDDADCRYADCVNHVGYVNRRPVWQKPTNVTTVCAPNASRGYDGDHCQYRETYPLFDDEDRLYYELVSVPCVVSPCKPGRYRVVGSVADQCLPCPSVPPPQPEYGDWLTGEEYKCKPGEYLRGFNSTEDKDCRRCPPDMIGRDRVKCEWCLGPLEEPYALDQSGCVCKAGAVMNRTGGCECGDGRRYNATTRGCELCPEDMYGVGGVCYECGGGTFAGVRGATVCQACAQGKFREAGTRSGGCQNCSGGPGHYAVEPWNKTCAACNRSCDEGRDGWMDGGPCPDGSAGFRVCVPCDTRLPVHGRWVRGGGCVYKCDAGYYFSEWDSGDCVACSTSPCPAGMQGQPCSEYEDRTCDTECSNASKPVFYSKWVQRQQQGDYCPWECVDGYSARTTDYVLFQIHECVPITGSSR